MRNQPSSKTAAVASSSCQYPSKTLTPFTSISPSTVIRVETPGSAGPTVPIRKPFTRLTRTGAVVSVRP